jgi:serine/threonine protein kinase
MECSSTLFAENSSFDVLSGMPSFRHEQIGNEQHKTSNNLLRSLTTRILETYTECNPNFHSPANIPRRMLTCPPVGVSNSGEDNEEGDLICRVGDRIEDTAHGKVYTIVDQLGKGSSGQTFSCLVDGAGRHVAVKIVKNTQLYTAQGNVERQITKLLNKTFDPCDERNIVRIEGYFCFKNHHCIVLESLGMSLIDAIACTHYDGLPLEIVRNFTRQIVTAMVALQEAQVVHCDLKPENILLDASTSRASLMSLVAETSSLPTCACASAFVCNPRTCTPSPSPPSSSSSPSPALTSAAPSPSTASMASRRATGKSKGYFSRFRDQSMLRSDSILTEMSAATSLESSNLSLDRMVAARNSCNHPGNGPSSIAEEKCPRCRCLSNLPRLKIIDFGSACFEGKSKYTYVQSRFCKYSKCKRNTVGYQLSYVFYLTIPSSFYLSSNLSFFGADRSPEVLLGVPYNCAVDMWSLACVSAEMFLGLPLFPGSSSHDQISRIIDMFGMPPDFMIQGKNGSKHFTQSLGREPVHDVRWRSAAGQSRGGRVLTRSMFRLKTAVEYADDTCSTAVYSPHVFKQKGLETVIMEYAEGKNSANTASSTEQKQAEAAEKADLECFIHFLRGLLRLNPLERWTAQEAAIHPFVTGAPFSPDFDPRNDLSALLKMRTVTYNLDGFEGGNMDSARRSEDDPYASSDGGSPRSDNLFTHPQYASTPSSHVDSCSSSSGTDRSSGLSWGTSHSASGRASGSASGNSGMAPHPRPHPPVCSQSSREFSHSQNLRKCDMMGIDKSTSAKTKASSKYNAARRIGGLVKRLSDAVIGMPHLNLSSKGGHTPRDWYSEMGPSDEDLSRILPSPCP